MLLVRGHYGVVLDKLNFYEDARFQRVVEANACQVPKLVAPAVALTREWPLFKAKPESGTAVDAWSEVEPTQSIDPPPLDGESASHRGPGDAPKPTIVRERLTAEDRLAISAFARRAFKDPRQILRVIEAAMETAADNDAAAIAFNLRTSPEFYGELRVYPKFISRKRRGADVSAVAKLRRGIIALRRAADQRRIVGNVRSTAAQNVPASDTKEAAVVIAMADAVHSTLAIAMSRADSATKSAELARIGEAFAKTRLALTDTERRENSMDGVTRRKPTRTREPT